MLVLGFRPGEKMSSRSSPFGTSDCRSQVSNIGFMAPLQGCPGGMNLWPVKLTGTSVDSDLPCQVENHGSALRL